MDTKKYKDNDWHVENCTEHDTNKSSSFENGYKVWWALSKYSLWHRNATPDSLFKQEEEDEEEESTQIIHAARYSGSSDGSKYKSGPTTCECGVYQIWRKFTTLWLVNKDGDISQEYFSNKIYDGPKGTKNKYLIFFPDKNDWNIISLARFNDHGTFTTEEEAIYFSNELINRNIGKLNEKVIINLHRLIEIQKENEKLFPKN